MADTLTFDEACHLVRTQMLAGGATRGLVVLPHGRESAGAFRVYVGLPDGEMLLDQPMVLVDKATGHTVVMSWSPTGHPSDDWPVVTQTA